VLAHQACHALQVQRASQESSRVSYSALIENVMQAIIFGSDDEILGVEQKGSD
jgi:hypothetical protein